MKFRIGDHVKCVCDGDCSIRGTVSRYVDASYCVVWCEHGEKYIKEEYLGLLTKLELALQ